MQLLQKKISLNGNNMGYQKVLNILFVSLFVFEPFELKVNLIELFLPTGSHGGYMLENYFDICIVLEYIVKSLQNFIK